MTLLVIHFFAVRNGRVMKSLVLVPGDGIETGLGAARSFGVPGPDPGIYASLKLGEDAIGELLDWIAKLGIGHRFASSSHGMPNRMAAVNVVHTRGCFLAYGRLPLRPRRGSVRGSA